MIIAGVFTLVLFAGGCRKNPENENPNLRVWYHAGQSAERKVMKRLIERFENKFPSMKLQVSSIPEKTYNAQLQAANMANELPDVLEFDGPFLYSYIWQNKLLALDDLLRKELKEMLLESIIEQGSYKGKLYAIGMFDSGLGLYVNLEILKKFQIRIPQGIKDAWTVEEFDQILTKMHGIQNAPVLDLKANYQGEWWSYGFMPVIHSAGGVVLNVKSTPKAEGYLNSVNAIESLSYFRRWFEKEYVDPNLDDAAFINKRVGISWVGHWEYPRYSRAIGESLAVLPLPDFGAGVKTGQGSWQWGVNKKTKLRDKAIKFLHFIFQKENIKAMTDANGAVPGRKDVIEASDLYTSDQGALSLFSKQLIQGVSVPRPKTPAYPMVTSAFNHALQDIRNGVDVKTALTAAAKLIDRDIQDNKGYQ